MGVLPEIVVGHRLVLRRWRPGDVAILGEAVKANIEHLKPWMPWIAFEPQSDSDRENLIRSWENDWIAGGDVVMGAFLEGRVVGGCGLHRRAGPGILEIGYWVHADHLRHGYATEIVRSLTSAALAVPGIERVEIHHDKANTRSRGVPEALGFQLDGESRRQPRAPREIGVDAAWSMNSEAWRNYISSWPQWEQVSLGFSVRDAVDSDIPSIRQCYLRSWRAAYDGFLDPGVLDDEAQKRQGYDWSRGIKKQSEVVLVAMDSANRVIGVVQAEEELQAPRDLPEIAMLYVDPALWGSRVAAQLLNAGLEWIAMRGHTAARLRVVEAHYRARRFYEREGWQLDPDLEPARNNFFRLIYYRRPLIG